MSEKLRCYGCGSILQVEDVTAPGYIQKDVLESDRESILCQRCFKMKNYGLLSEVTMKNEDFLELLDKISKENCLIVYVIDIFNFHASLIKNFDRNIRNNPVIVVLNKIDILPRYTNLKKQINYIGDMLWERNIFPISLIPISSKTGENIDKLMETIYENRNDKNVYIVGMANVGKSTLINQLLKVYSNETTHFVTTSQFPGTTLKTIEIPLDETTFIYDTPGVINERSIWQHLEYSVLKKILPKRQIRPRTYQLNSGQTILIGGLAALDYKEGPRSSFTFVLSNEVELNRVKSENKEASFNSMYENNQLKPKSKRFKEFKEFELKELEIPAANRVEIIIYGLGNIKINYSDGSQKVNLYLPKGVKAIIRQG